MLIEFFILFSIIVVITVLYEYHKRISNNIISIYIYLIIVTLYRDKLVLTLFSMKIMY